MHSAVGHARSAVVADLLRLHPRLRFGAVRFGALQDGGDGFAGESGIGPDLGHGV